MMPLAGFLSDWGRSPVITPAVYLNSDIVLQHQLQRLSRACFLLGELPPLGSTDLLRREALLSASVCS